VTWTVDDGNGNTDVCSVTITIEDNEAPTISCPADISVNSAAGACDAIVTFANPVGMDNCAVASTIQTAGLPSGSVFPVGTTTNTFEVTDASGNTASCSFDVTVVDDEAPVIACPADVVASTDLGICGAEVFFTDAIAIDSCGGVTVTQTMGDPSGSIFPVGDTTIEFTATDTAGNVSTCTFTITVTDDEAPITVCNDITIALDASGFASIVAADIDGGATDNCGIDTISIDIDTFDCSNVGTNVVTLTATDAAGLSSSCTAIVTVEDVTAPVAVCQNITVALDTAGTITVLPSQIDGGSTDACGIDTISLDIDTFDCSNVGDNNVILTVTDVNGNTSTCTAVITVEDNTVPVVNCIDITIALDENGIATITPDDVATFGDACEPIITAVDITEFNCDDIGAPIEVVVFAQDNNGNLATCTAMVTVIDTLPPVVTCPEDQTVDPGPGNLFYEVPDYWALGDVTALDNCTDPVVVTSQDPVAGSLISDGVYTVTTCATDQYGNQDCCTFQLTVESTLGTDDIAIDISSVVLYPNPAINTVSLSNPKAIALEEAKVYDMSGRLVASFNLRDMGTSKTFDVSTLATATYTVMISGQGKTIAKKLMKR
jgi:hypothetical protein